MIKDVANFIPRPLRDINSSWSAFITYFRNLYSEFFNKILGLRNFFIAESTPYPFYLSELVAAYINQRDSIDTVRKKTYGAIGVHKNLPNFVVVYKPIIDGILGGNSSIYTGQIYYGSFIVGKSIIGSQSKIGIVPFSASNFFPNTYGTIYINLDIVPNSNQLQLLIYNLQPLVPQYFNVFIGNIAIIVSSRFVVGTSQIGGTDLIGIALGNLTTFNILYKL